MERETKERLLLCSVLFWVVLGSFEFSLMQIPEVMAGFRCRATPGPW